jgi:hypothetical protein
MIQRRLTLFVIFLVVSALLWGGILSFTNPFDCQWPTTEELIAISGIPNSSVNIDSNDQSPTQLETEIALKIGRTGVSKTPFNPERDFIEHAVDGPPRIWQYTGGELIPTSEGILLEIMQSPVDMSEYFSGEFPRLFRFAILSSRTAQACVIVERDDSVGGMHYFYFWHFFRMGFGLGPWWRISEGGVLYGW